MYYQQFLCSEILQCGVRKLLMCCIWAFDKVITRIMFCYFNRFIFVTKIQVANYLISVQLLKIFCLQIFFQTCLLVWCICLSRFIHALSRCSKMQFWCLKKNKKKLKDLCFLFTHLCIIDKYMKCVSCLCIVEYKTSSA